MRKRNGVKPVPAARRRRDAASARAAILDAAEKRLVEAGPAGIRLQEVAADAGVSHPTVLHHFGSREALVNAVSTRALAAIHGRLVQAIGASSGEQAQLTKMLEDVYDALCATGYGRVLLWLALEGQSIDATEVRLSDVIGAAHALRISKHRDRGSAHVPPREDTAHAVVLTALALLGASVLGPRLFENAGLGPDPPAGVRFRAWLARVVLRYFDAGEGALGGSP